MVCMMMMMRILCGWQMDAMASKYFLTVYELDGATFRSKCVQLELQAPYCRAFDDGVSGPLLQGGDDVGDGSRTLGCTMTISAQPRGRVQTSARLHVPLGTCIDPATARSVAEDRGEDLNKVHLEA